MTHPKLTFFCELPAGALQALFADARVVSDLLALGARVSLGILDLTAERAAVVHQLNEAGIPVVAWQLLPKEQGYWFNLDNATQATARYVEFKRWTAKHQLRWDGIGLDIEPDIREMQGLRTDPLAWLPVLLKRTFDEERLRRAQMAYNALMAQIRCDDYRVDVYHLPFVVDERAAGSTLLQRLAGLVDLTADREVLMLYTSLMRPRGPAVLWSYAKNAQSVGLGVTGGGVDVTADIPPLNWDEFSRDLVLASRWARDIHVFSLEGCVQQGFLPRLQSFDWEQQDSPPRGLSAQVAAARTALRAGLWASAHPSLLLAAGLAMLAWASRRHRRT